MYYLCADDSNLLSSWPEYPTANTVFPPVISQTLKTQQVQRQRPWCCAWNPFLLQCFLSPGIEWPFLQGCALESLDSFLSQLSFPFLINHRIFYVGPLSHLKPTSFSTATPWPQATTLFPQTIVRSCWLVTPHSQLGSQTTHLKSPKPSFSWETDWHFSP